MIYETKILQNSCVLVYNANIFQTTSLSGYSMIFKSLFSFFGIFLGSILIFLSHAQAGTDKYLHAQRVFDRLVAVMGRGKVPPVLRLVPQARSQKIAEFRNGTPPTVLLDEKAYDLCLTFADRADDALAALLGHELVHYYHGHAFTAYFAAENAGKNAEVVQLATRLRMEQQADEEGGWYAHEAGFQSFSVLPALLEKLYTAYGLHDATQRAQGYPTRHERVALAQQAQERLQQLLPVWESSRLFMLLGRYEQAIVGLSWLLQQFPTADLHLNLGACYLQEALTHLPPSAFRYPVATDAVSYLEQVRGNSSDNAIQEKLQHAAKHFSAALEKRANYLPAYVNQALTQHIMGNDFAALGTLEHLKKQGFALDAAAHTVWALVQFSRGAHTEAEAHFQQALPDPVYGAHNWRVFQQKMGKTVGRQGAGHGQDHQALEPVGEIIMASLQLDSLRMRTTWPYVAFLSEQPARMVQGVATKAFGEMGGYWYDDASVQLYFLTARKSQTLGLDPNSTFAHVQKRLGGPSARISAAQGYYAVFQPKGIAILFSPDHLLQKIWVYQVVR